MACKTIIIILFLLCVLPYGRGYYSHIGGVMVINEYNYDRTIKLQVCMCVLPYGRGYIIPMWVGLWLYSQDQ